MKRKGILRAFFFPPVGSPRWRRILPYAVLLTVVGGVFVGVVFAWDYTNSPTFCGTTCHLMPPEYTAYLVSPHARVLCVDCHMGQDYTMIKAFRKVGEFKHLVSLIFKRYRYPITAHELTPARETCEQCHTPSKFSDDSLREIRHFSEDEKNTPTSIYLIFKTGGGSKRQGLGRGIHWHIENEVYYLPTDEQEQQIPFVRVVKDDGSTVDYVDVESRRTLRQVLPSELKKMDCISCHNRITHLIYQPETAVEQLMIRQVISPAIPEIRHRAVETLRRPFVSMDSAMSGIAGLAQYYRTAYPDFYAGNKDKVDAAIAALQDFFRQSVYIEENTDWNSHPDNIGHLFSPGCLRCHDGKHLNAQNEAIRLECNLCHSIPVVAGPSDIVADVEISRGAEPQSHLNANWLALHREIFDATCANCHSTEDPGGSSNTSFCSNSSCHGTKWVYAGLDAPGLRDVLRAQLPPPVTPPPTTPGPEGPATYDATVGPLLRERCGVCHGTNGMKGVNLTTYAATMAGGVDGPVVVPGEPDSSLLVTVQVAGNHPGQLNEAELALVRTWIETGAAEK